MKFRLEKDEKQQKELVWRLTQEHGDICLQVKGSKEQWWYVLTVKQEDGTGHLNICLPHDLGLPLNKEGQLTIN